MWLILSEGLRVHDVNHLRPDARNASGKNKMELMSDVFCPAVEAVCLSRCSRGFLSSEQVSQTPSHTLLELSKGSHDTRKTSVCRDPALIPILKPAPAPRFQPPPPPNPLIYDSHRRAHLGVCPTTHPLVRLTNPLHFFRPTNRIL